MSRKEALSQFINQIHGRPVVVKLNSGVDYRGTYSINNYSVDPASAKTNFVCIYPLQNVVDFKNII